MEEKDKIYYIGFNANNAICNENFFEGSITLYPNREKGNIYYSDTIIKDTKSNQFMENYQKYIHDTALKIQNSHPEARFLCFNPKIKKMCSELYDIKIIDDSMEKLTDFFNNKYETRKYVKDIIPILDYIWLDGKDIAYQKLKKQLNADMFVIQGIRGAGGDNTFLIRSEEEMEQLIDREEGFYCVSRYTKNTPLNATLVVGESDILFFPISAQLILLENHKFKYYGGDFSFAQELPADVIERVKEYSYQIGRKVQADGYRGIIGIDLILEENQHISFMEINPRFQSSSFLINLYLEKLYHTCLAEQHYLALTGKKLMDISYFSIHHSFLNCNREKSFDEYQDFELILNGYFEDNVSSNYRKVFPHSILKESSFERT